MDLNKLKTLIDLVAESNITELEVTEGDEKIKIIKNGNGNMAATPAAMPAIPLATPVIYTAAATPVAATPPITPPTAAVTVATTPAGKTIKSPMVGTFYTASAPDKPSFVSVGSEVKSAQTVCIIEAMKLLNEIEAGMDGTIVEILVKSGSPVEFGQPLFTVA